jgi:hypothetical protein
MTIAQNIRSLMESVPRHVLVVAAAKTRTAEEVREAAEAGIKAIGHNYVQEAEAMQVDLGKRRTQESNGLRWHLIGHLQRNKAKRAAEIFDMIETLDSLRLARALDRQCAEIGKKMPALIEINSGRESNKTGVDPEETESLVREIAQLDNIKIRGLMTMGPRFGNPEDARPYFRLVRDLFDKLSSADIEGVEMDTLSMGMSNSYHVAIQEGANVVRIGTALFGERCRT